MTDSDELQWDWKLQYAYVGNNPLNARIRGEGIFGAIGWILGPIGHFIGEGVDALVFGPDSTKFDNAPNLGGLFGGCGGILGNCGSVGGGAWNEQVFGPGVHEPGGLLIQDFGTITSNTPGIPQPSFLQSDFSYISLSSSFFPPSGSPRKAALALVPGGRVPGYCTETPLAKLNMRSPFGRRPNPFTGTPGQFHPGRDYAASTGTPVFAAEGGRVNSAGPFGGLVTRY